MSVLNLNEIRRWQKLANILVEEVSIEEPGEDVPTPPEAEQPEAEPEIEPAPSPEEEPGLITRDAARMMIKNTKGKFFTVTFVKKDGTTRVMNCRLGVRAYLKGGELPYNPDEKGLIPVYDVQTRDYRMINAATITNLKIGNKEYQVN